MLIEAQRSSFCLYYLTLLLLESRVLRGVVTVLVGVEARLADEDAGADTLCVADGMDRVLGELCSRLIKAVASRFWGIRSLRSMCGLIREFPSSLRNILNILCG